MEHRKALVTQAIPTPPPLPRPRPPQKTSKFALKVAAAPPGWGFESSNKEAIKDFWDSLTPPAGTYFFYGTLQDPGMLAEILELDTLPTLRPAFMIGYELKLWGQYPALVYGKTGDLVEGLSFNVPSKAAAARLAAYETKNYCPAPCNVRMKDSEGNEEVVEGWSFMYCGPEQDLSEGVFDLGVWLKRMRR